MKNNCKYLLQFLKMLQKSLIEKMPEKIEKVFPGDKSRQKYWEILHHHFKINKGEFNYIFIQFILVLLNVFIQFSVSEKQIFSSVIL